jgi:predicted nucleic acid-binding protein
MKLVADTGALISLESSHYKELIFSENSFIITKAVIQELKDFSAYEDTLGKSAKDVIIRKLSIKEPKKAYNIGLGKAESEVFSLAQELKCLALTDDAHAARVAKERLGILSKPSFYLLLLLYKKKKLTKQELIEDIHSIVRKRNWLQGALWNYAEKLIEEL